MKISSKHNVLIHSLIFWVYSSFKIFIWKRWLLKIFHIGSNFRSLKNILFNFGKKLFIRKWGFRLFSNFVGSLLCPFQTSLFDFRSLYLTSFPVSCFAITISSSSSAKDVRLSLFEKHCPSGSAVMFLVVLKWLAQLRLRSIKDIITRML